MTDRDDVILQILNSEMLCNDCGENTASYCAEAIVDLLNANGMTVQRWIPVTERLPEEHETMFSKLYGTDRWDSAMSRTVSDDVVACIKFPDGVKMVKILRTYSGEWRLTSGYNAKVTHWMPLPQAPKDGDK